LCEYCKEPAELSQNLIHDFQRIGLGHSNIFQPTGCKKCEGTGYLGRTAVCDILAVTEQLKADINNSKVSAAKLKTDDKIKSHLRREGLKKVAVGITSLKELKRVVG
jgi:general secretion pathway protein E